MQTKDWDKLIGWVGVVGLVVVVVLMVTGVL